VPIPFRHISEHCPFLRNKIYVTIPRDPTLTHHNAGREFWVNFVSYNKDPGQFEIEADTDNPLVGQNVQFIHTTPVPFSKNLLFNPIPFEMVETYEKKPQLLVEVGTLPAVCHSMKCDFTTIAAVGEIASFTYNAATKALVMTGTNLPTNKNEIQ